MSLRSLLANLAGKNDVPASAGRVQRKTAPPKERRFAILSHVALKTLL